MRIAALVLPAAACLTAAAADAPLRPWPARQATPALRLAGLDGRTWDLAALRGKVVVINFWASWCGPCVEELPVLGALARRAGRDVVVLGVNYMEPRSTIDGFIGDQPLPYPLLRDRDGAAFKAWTAGVMPTTIVVDRQGRARWRTVGPIDANDTGLQRAIAALQAE
jgi:cytochrome c biogenesis protein CcmG/thiol:disulfide interchange protein DsbE